MQALSIVANERPEAVLIGSRRETEHEALTVAQSISSMRTDTKVVFLGDNPDRRTMSAMPAFRAAGWSYLLRQSVNDVATLVRAIDGAASGLVVMDPAVVERLGQRDSRLGALTKRQLEVLSLMAKGYNNAAIARALVLEEKSRREPHQRHLRATQPEPRQRRPPPREGGVAVSVGDAG